MQAGTNHPKVRFMICTPRLLLWKIQLAKRMVLVTTDLIGLSRKPRRKKWHWA